MDIAVLDACPGFKEDVLHAAQDRDESVEVVQGVDQQRNPVGDDRCGLHQAAAALAPGRGQEDPVSEGWCQTLFLVLTCRLRNQKQSLTPRTHTTHLPERPGTTATAPSRPSAKRNTPFPKPP